MRRHDARHPLPISNGYGGPGTFGPPTVWCGYCSASFPADREWVDRYIARRWRRLRQQELRGYMSPREVAHVAKDIDDEKARLMAAVKEINNPELWR